MWVSLFVVSSILANVGILAQTVLYGCPKGWERHQRSCYKFVMENAILEEAEAACWVNGATLLSISDVAEQKFVEDWLLKHDTLNPSTWFTSGLYSRGILLWEGDGTIASVEQGVNNWINGHFPSPDSTLTRVAYQYGGVIVPGFYWTVVSTSTPSKYICEIQQSDIGPEILKRRDHTYGQSNISPADIKIGPSIIKEPESVVIFGSTESVYIECAASGNPHPGFRWWRDKNESISSVTSGRYTLSGARFTVQNPEETKDHGSYQCEAENEFGSVLSQPAQMFFGRLQHFSNVRPEDVQANKFEGTRINCQAPAAYPASRFEWFQWNTNEFIFQDHAYMFVSSSGYLYFSEVQPTDGRKYYCVVTLTAPTIYRAANAQPPSRTSLGTWLIVTGFEHGIYEPFIYTHAYPTPAIRGSQVRLECIAYGSLPLFYQWRRADGRPFPEGTRIFDRSRVLTIDNVQLDAEGDYICTCNGKAGSTEKTISLVLEARPYFPYTIGDMFVDPNQAIRWRCKAVARPKAVYTWFKNGKQIESIPGQIEVRKNYLYIPNVDETRDEGMYQCAATNVHGTSFSSGQLKVLSFTPVFTRPLPPTTLAPMGGNLTLPCDAEAAPLPTVRWLKNGNDMGLMRGEVSARIGMSLEQDLVMTAIEYSDTGRYTCVATNDEGEASTSTDIQVIRGITVSQGPQNTRALVNTTAFLNCQAAYDSQNTDLTYIWKFNGHLIDFQLSQHHVMSTRSGVDGLYIIQAQFRHSGVYTCVAKTTLHSAEREAFLSVDGPPGPPAGVYVDPLETTSYSARLIWTTSQGIEHGSPVTSYDVEAEAHYYPGVWKKVAFDIPETAAVNLATTKGLRGDQRSMVVEGLIPNSNYRFRVRAINSFGRGREASLPSASVRTPATAPVLPPTNVGGGGGKVGTLVVTWTPLDISEESGPEIGYYVYWRRKGNPTAFQNATLHGVHTNYSHTLGAEYYFLEYEVKVGSFNKFGPGPNSTVSVIYSAEGIPVAAPIMGDCDNYNGSAIYVEWTPVPDDREHMKGRVKGYTVQYYHIDMPDYIWTRELYGQQENTVIIGLEDNSNYMVRVQVFNSAARGPIGEWRLGETFHLPPRLYPRHVKIYSHGPNSIRVTWQGITTEFDEESLEGYIVRVWKIQEDIRTANDTVVGKVPEAIVEGLQSRTVYVMRVLGYSIGGEGSMSNHVYFTVGGGSVPFDPSTTEYCYEDGICAGASFSFSRLLLAFSLLLSFLMLYR